MFLLVLNMIVQYTLGLIPLRSSVSPPLECLINVIYYNNDPVFVLEFVLWIY